MADDKENEEKPLLKYRYVEEFPESIDPKTGKPYEGIESPKMVETEHFGKRLLHQIAKVKWTETKFTQVYETKGTEGKLEEKEFTVRVYEQEMGEVGGWIEDKKNLDQAGDCWVSEKAVVVDDAQVFGDAEVKGEAEVGEYATVGGKAKVYGQVCIKGYAHILGDGEVYGDKEELEEDVDEKWKKGMKRKRVAVTDYATVMGEVRGTAKVYGDAYVGPHSLISDKAKVYGSARVEGDDEEGAYVEGEAKVYGRAVVNGTVGDKCEAYGRAHIGKGGELEEEIKLFDGTVFGLITGKRSMKFLYLFVGKGSKIAFYKDGEKRPPLAFKERDMSQAKNYAVMGRYGRDVVLIVGKDCTLEYCDFYGRIVLDKTTARYSALCHVMAEDSWFDDCAVVCTRAVGVDAEKSILIDSQVGGTKERLKDTTVNHGIVPDGANWEGVSAGGVTDVERMVGTVTGRATKSEIDKTPTAYPYAERSNYDTWIENGAMVFKEPYKPKEIERIETKYGTFTKDKYGMMQLRYCERQAQIKKIVEPLQKRYDALVAKAKSGEDLNDEEWQEKSVLGYYAIPWIEGAVGVNYYDLYDDLWNKVVDALQQTANACLGSQEVQLFSPYKLVYVTERDREQRDYIQDFQEGVEITPFMGRFASKDGGWFVTVINGFDSPFNGTKGYEEHLKFGGGGWGGINELVKYTETHDQIYWQYDQDKIEEVHFDDLVKAFEDKVLGFESGDIWVSSRNMNSISVIYLYPYTWGAHGSPEEEVRKINDQIAEMEKDLRKAIGDRVSASSYSAEEQEAITKKKWEEWDAIWEERRQREEKQDEEKKYVATRKAAIQTAKQCLSSIRIKSKGSSEQTWANQAAQILGELLYGSPSKEECESLAKQAQEIYSLYLRKITEENSKK